MESLKQQNEERALAVLQARRAGSTRMEVAIQQGISRERVRQLECRGLELEIERASSDPQYELPVRTRNCVLNGGCPAVVPELVAAHFKSVYELSCIPNMGKLSIKYLQEWLIRHGQKPIPGSESYKPPPAPSGGAERRPSHSRLKR
jgi:hypothetical protein